MRVTRIVIRNSSGFGLVVAMLMTSVGAQESEPPALPVPPPVPLILDQEGMRPEFERGLPPSTALEDEDEDALSVFDVPLLEIPSDGEAEQEEVLRIGSFSLLNKVTAKLRPVELVLGEPTDIGSLRVVMRDCISTPPEEPLKQKCFLRFSSTNPVLKTVCFRGGCLPQALALMGLNMPFTICGRRPAKPPPARGSPALGENRHFARVHFAVLRDRRFA